MMKKTLLAVAVSATLFTFDVSANTNARANSATSEATSASVGHRPVAAVKDGKNLLVSGSLMTGETLTIEKFFITDADGDGEGKDGDEANLAKTIADVKWVLVRGTDRKDLAANKAEITIPADAAGGQIEVTYTVRTLTGTPDAAILPTSIILTPGNSGVTGGIDGTITANLASVSIEVEYAADGQPGAAPSDAVNGTDVQGTPVVGSTLKANVQCYSGGIAGECDSSQTFSYRWTMSDSANGPFNTDVGTGQTHQVTGTQQGKFFKVEVTPVTTKSDAPAQKTKRR